MHPIKIVILSIISHFFSFSFLFAQNQCKKLFIQNSTSLVDLRNSSLVSMELNVNRFLFNGFLEYPNLIGEFVKIKYSHGDGPAAEVSGTVISQLEGYILILESNGFTSKEIRIENLKIHSLLHATNYAEPMPFTLVTAGLNGLNKLLNQSSNIGNEVKVLRNGNIYLTGFIVSESHGRIVVYSPTENQLSASLVFTEVRLEKSSGFEGVYMRTPTRPNLPFPIRELELEYELQNLQNRHGYLSEAVKNHPNELNIKELQKNGDEMQIIIKALKILRNKS